LLYNPPAFHQLESGPPFPLHPHPSKPDAPLSAVRPSHQPPPSRKESVGRRSSFPLSLTAFWTRSTRRRPAESRPLANSRTGLMASQRKNRRWSPSTRRRSSSSGSAARAAVSPTGRHRSTAAYRSGRSRLPATRSMSYSSPSSSLSLSLQTVGLSAAEFQDKREAGARSPNGGGPVENLGLVCDEYNGLESERELA
jgi:hypothetical protein